MRVFVLVHKPSSLPGFVVAPASHMGVKEPEAVPADTEEKPAEVCGQTSQAVIQADDDKPTGFDEAGKRSEAAQRVAGMVKYSVADYDIEQPFPESWPEQVHLNEPGIFDLTGVSEVLCQTQRIQTEIRPENQPVPGHTQKIAELARATTRLEHQGALGYLLIEQPGEDALVRIFCQSLRRIEIVVVRKGVPFIEFFHKVGYIARPILC